MRAVGYLRVSTEKQAEGSISIDAQRTKIQAYCLALDIELVAICADKGVSANRARGLTGYGWPATSVSFITSYRGRCFRHAAGRPCARAIASRS